MSVLAGKHTLLLGKVVSGIPYHSIATTMLSHVFVRSAKQLENDTKKTSGCGRVHLPTAATRTIERRNQQSVVIR